MVWELSLILNNLKSSEFFEPFYVFNIFEEEL